MGQKIAFLHLSDIHISDFVEKHHKTKIVSNFSKYPSYAEVFFDDLLEYLEKQEIKLLAAIITGDLANNGEIIDYTKVQSFLNVLRDKFTLTNSDILITPGNHDINWFESEAAWRADKEQKKAYEYHIAKFNNFKQFFDTFYEKEQTFNPEDAIAIVKCYHEIKICFIGLNSNFEESFQGEDHHGFINCSSLEANLRDITDKYPDYKKIAFWHHNPVFIEDESKTLMNWDSVSTLLLKNKINNYLFGHSHKDESKKIIYKDSYSFFSVGSIGKGDLVNSYSLFIQDVIDDYYAKFNRVLFKFMPSESDQYRKTGYWEKQEKTKDYSELIISLKAGYEPGTHLAKLPEKSPLAVDYKASNSFEGDVTKNIEEISRTNEEDIIEILKIKKLVKSGHFHWGGNRKTRTWIDTNMLFSDRKVLNIIRNDFITKIKSINTSLQINFDLVMGLGIEGNILASPLAVVFNCYYSYFPVPSRNDYNKFEKQLIEGKFKNIILVMDVVFEGSTIKDFINKYKDFFKEVELVLVLSVFQTGGEKFDPSSFETEFGKKFFFSYLTNQIKIEKCSLDSDGCSICNLGLENVHNF